MQVTGEKNAVTTFCDNMSTKLTANTNENVKSLQNCCQTIDDATAKNEVLMASIITLLGQMKEAALESAMNNNRIKQVLPTLRHIESTMEEQTNQNIKEIASYGSEMHQLISDMSDKVNDCDGSVKAMDSNATKMIGVNRTKDSEMIDAVHAMHSTFGAQKNQMSSQLDEMLNEIGNINEMTEISIDAGLNKLINECSDEQERIDNGLHQFNEMHANSESIHTDFVHKLTDDIKTCSERLHTFQQEELKIYQPTGQTPCKQEYSYPRKLAATSPHAKITKDYWQQHNNDTTLDCSIIIPEELPIKVEAAVETLTEASTILDSSPTVVDGNETCNTTADRTLCENHSMNAYSTPYARSEISKLPMPTKSSMFENITVITVCG